MRTLVSSWLGLVLLVGSSLPAASQWVPDVYRYSTLNLGGADPQGIGTYESGTHYLQARNAYGLRSQASVTNINDPFPLVSALARVESRDPADDRSVLDTAFSSAQMTYYLRVNGPAEKEVALKVAGIGSSQTRGYLFSKDEMLENWIDSEKPKLGQSTFYRLRIDRYDVASSMWLNMTAFEKSFGFANEKGQSRSSGSSVVTVLDTVLTVVTDTLLRVSMIAQASAMNSYSAKVAEASSYVDPYFEIASPSPELYSLTFSPGVINGRIEVPLSPAGCGMILLAAAIWIAWRYGTKVETDDPDVTETDIWADHL